MDLVGSGEHTEDKCNPESISGKPEGGRRSVGIAGELSGQFDSDGEEGDRAGAYNCEQRKQHASIIRAYYIPHGRYSLCNTGSTCNTERTMDRSIVGYSVNVRATYRPR